MDTLLIGRHDGSLATIDVVDSSTYRCKELAHCCRNGKLMLVQNYKF